MENAKTSSRKHVIARVLAMLMAVLMIGPIRKSIHPLESLCKKFFWSEDNFEFKCFS